ncbi:MAG TPA: porin [Xanthobacteraceae bacterium]|nr:porin [Xanthobacteraceae bacterium]
MTFVKSVVLGSAAGLVAIARGQAADLPVKAKPVEYVKVCSLYGAGFWYVPGTDTCLKIGSYIRGQVEWNAGNGGVPIGFGATDAAAAGRLDRTDTSQLSFRTRAGLSVDLRTQTEYGTLRSYFEGGFQTSGNNGSAPTNDAVYVDRGFVQFAGLTAGRIRSYFDINSFGSYSYANVRFSADTTALGLWGIAYTAQLGNGISATISLEDGGSSSQGNSSGQTGSRLKQVVNLSMAAQFGLGTTSFDNEGWKVPDVVGSLRIDRAWGYAQVSAALHDVSAGYYQTGGTALAAGLQNNGHPADAYGFAVSGGFTLNDVLGWSGDQLGMQVAYGRGAGGYTFKQGPTQVYGSGNSAGFGWTSDGTFVAGGPVELTTSWSINGLLQHFWSPKWRTSLYGGYYEVDYDAKATANICPGGAAGTPSPTGFPFAGGVTNCSPNWSAWGIGSRTQWNPHSDLDIGVDLMWDHLNTAFAGFATVAANGARPLAAAGSFRIQDQDVLTILFRIQRNLLP